MAIRYTYTDAEPVGDAYINPGEYRVQVISYQFGLSKSGNDKIDIRYRVLETGTTLSESIAFTEKAQWKFDLLLKCIAPSKNIALPAKGQQIEIDAGFIQTYLLNGTGQVTVGEEEYNGKMRSKITSYNEGEYQTTASSHRQGYQQNPRNPAQHTPPDATQVTQEEGDLPF